MISHMWMWTDFIQALHDWKHMFWTQLMTDRLSCVNKPKEIWEVWTKRVAKHPGRRLTKRNDTESQHVPYSKDLIWSRSKGTAYSHNSFRQSTICFSVGYIPWTPVDSLNVKKSRGSKDEDLWPLLVIAPIHFLLMCSVESSRVVFDLAARCLLAYGTTCSVWRLKTESG